MYVFTKSANSRTETFHKNVRSRGFNTIFRHYKVYRLLKYIKLRLIVHGWECKHTVQTYYHVIFLVTLWVHGNNRRSVLSPGTYFTHLRFLELWHWSYLNGWELFHTSNYGFIIGFLVIHEIGVFFMYGNVKYTTM